MSDFQFPLSGFLISDFPISGADFRFPDFLCWFPVSRFPVSGGLGSQLLATAGLGWAGWTGLAKLISILLVTRENSDAEI